MHREILNPYHQDSGRPPRVVFLRVVVGVVSALGLPHGPCGGASTRPAQVQGALVQGTAHTTRSAAAAADRRYLLPGLPSDVTGLGDERARAVGLVPASRDY